jgi:DNA gyrase subunit A
VVVTLSQAGYIKAQPLDEIPRAEARRARQAGATTKEDDFIEKLFIANTHDYVLCFSNKGKLYWIKVYEVPQGSRTSRGKPIVNLLKMDEGERINAILPVKEFTEDRYVFFATQEGVVKKTSLAEFSRPRPSGIIAVDLDEGDCLVAWRSPTASTTSCSSPTRARRCASTRTTCARWAAAPAACAA